MIKSDSVFLGVDGGGTGCRAVLVSRSGTLLGVGVAGAANIATGLSKAVDNIVEASRMALSEAGLEHMQLFEIPVFMGLAGANIGDSLNRARGRIPFRLCCIETDAVTSLEGAIGDGDGVAAVIGTGSVFVSRIDGQIRTIGGWGFAVGDLASGAWMGQQLLRKTLLGHDGVHRESRLTQKVLSRFNNDPRLMAEYAHTARPGEFGEWAPLVFEFAERRDPIARQILGRAISDVEETLDHILPDEHVRFCMIGGVGAVYADMLSKYYRTRVSKPLADAATGAANLARKTFSQGKAYR